MIQAYTLANQAKVLSTLELHIVDNSNSPHYFQSIENLLKKFKDSLSLIKLSATNKNIGYGRAHNQTIFEQNPDFHLILNPDVILDSHCFVNAIRYLEKNNDVVMVAPAVIDSAGHKSHLCKSYPSLFVLFFRGFFKRFRNSWIKRKLYEYELRELNSESKEIEIASGCFMFFKQSALKNLEGFSPIFFLYFEDFDLSYRCSKVAKIAFVPSVIITHFGGNAAKKGLKHILLFSWSAFKFFNRFGWRVV